MKPKWAMPFVFVALLSEALVAQPTVSPFESPAAPTAQSRIDELVFGKLRRLNIHPANGCSDAVFVRRVYLDVIGTLPTAEETRSFLQDNNPTKRAVLIDRLLERDEFADYWAMKWCDLLRVKSEFPINLWPNAVQSYHRWIRTCVKENVPYDRFVREMLTASGSNFRVPQVNFYRAIQSREPQAIAQAVALTFIGTRDDKWPPERLSAMSAFFSQIGYKGTAEWKEEIVFFDLSKATTKPAAPTTAPTTAPAFLFPDGKPARLPPDQDPRQVFADWLVAPGNPWFARNIVNRIWFWLLGRGVIEEPDDIRPDNPPSVPELLPYLERELISHHYDLKHVYRLILNSQVYQLSCIPRTDRPEGQANFASYPLRRLDAEVLIDALCQITGTTEEYSSRIPEPFTFIPETQRTIALPDGSITSPFLDMFGRPPRDTGLANERNNRPTADQRLHMLNSSHIQRKIEQSTKLRSLLQPGGGPREIVNRFYLTILSRFPTDEELNIATEQLRSSPGNRWLAAVDLAWAMINSDEFLYRH
jgi:hypothetical protein